MPHTNLIVHWKLEQSRPMAGWDFSYLDTRMHTDPLPWSYDDHAGQLLRASTSALDMGTAGGERLLSLREHWPPRLAVTEDYAPNLALARERLEPLGVRVEGAPLTEADEMPFADGEFDLALNRHSGMNCAEVARVLAPAGVFYTQQVHALWAHDLAAEFGAEPQSPDATPEYYVPRLVAAGLEVTEVKEWQGDLTFTDVGAIVFYLKAIPWTVPGFSVETHLNALLRLQGRLDAGEELRFVARQYMIEARRPA